MHTLLYVQYGIIASSESSVIVPMHAHHKSNNHKNTLVKVVVIVHS